MVGKGRGGRGVEGSMCLCVGGIVGLKWVLIYI